MLNPCRMMPGRCPRLTAIAVSSLRPSTTPSALSTVPQRSRWREVFLQICGIFRFSLRCRMTTGMFMCKLSAKNVEFAKNRWLFGAQGPSITANSDGLENKRWPSAKTEFFTIYKESRRAPPLVYGQKLLVLPHNL